MDMFRLLGTGALVVALSACSSGSGDGSVLSDQQAIGKLSIGLTDGPVDMAEEVVVTVSSVQVHGEDKKTIQIDPPQAINLLDYQGNTRIMLLDDETFTAGEYQWIRLGIDEDDTYIIVEGQQYPLEIPSASKTGLKLNRPFTIGAGSSSDFTIDFDLKKSVHQEGTGDYKLRPTLRVVDMLESNTVTGTVDALLVEDVDCNNGDNNDTGNSVYLYEEFDATVQDLQGNEGDPLVTAFVNYNNESSEYEFEIGFVPLGEYTIAFTCDGSLDIATEDNSADMVFTAGQNVTVADGDPVVVVIE